jgi:hypothetical protein
VRRKLELRQHRDHRNSTRKSVQPPRERKRTEWQHPDHELRRQHLAEDGEAGGRREGGEDKLASIGRGARVPGRRAPPMSKPDAQECYECDEGAHEEPRECVRGRVYEAV